MGRSHLSFPAEVAPPDAPTALNTSLTSFRFGWFSRENNGGTWILKKLGINNIHMYADLFTVNREQVVNLCKMMIDQKINVKWTCNSRVDFVDKEELELTRKAGCWFLSWGIESGNDDILQHAHKGVNWQSRTGIEVGARCGNYELGLFHYRFNR